MYIKMISIHFLSNYRRLIALHITCELPVSLPPKFVTLVWKEIPRSHRSLFRRREPHPVIRSRARARRCRVETAQLQTCTDSCFVITNPSRNDDRGRQQHHDRKDLIEQASHAERQDMAAEQPPTPGPTPLVETQVRWTRLSKETVDDYLPLRNHSYDGAIWEYARTLDNLGRIREGVLDVKVYGPVQLTCRNASNNDGNEHGDAVGKPPPVA